MQQRVPAQRAIISLESESEIELDSEVQALPARREIIDIECDWEDEFGIEDDFGFGNEFPDLNGSGLQALDEEEDEEVALHRPRRIQEHPDLWKARPDGRSSYDRCQAEILEIFPDISHDHIRKLHDAQVQQQNNDAERASIAQLIILKVLDEKTYPKEKDVIGEKKRKRSNELDTDEEEAARWKGVNRGQETVYLEIARRILVDEFPSVPVRFVESTLKDAGNLYAAYMVIDLEEYKYPDNPKRPYARVKTPRKPRLHTYAPVHPTSLELMKEIEAARNNRDKEHTKRQLEKDAAEAEALTDKEYRDNGDVLDCQCCFDSFAINKITHCDGDEPHFFCLECAEKNAKNEIGNSRHHLKCMDFSGCTASFSREQKRRFLDDKSLEALERIQQQTELNQAELANLYKCPFCDFAAICPPVSVDKEFRCRNPGCEKTTCRLCKLDSHLPLSCEESRKENGISERHIVEEARTQALLRTCPKCNVKILKEDGCNKVTCTCGGMLCDFCGKDISKDGYAHFDGSGVRPRPHGMAGGPGHSKKCPTYDNFHDRRTKELEKAETQALEEIRLENPDVNAEDLKIKFKESTQSPPRRPGAPIPAVIRHRPIPPLPQYPIYPYHHDPYMLRGDLGGAYAPLPPGMRRPEYNIPPNIPRPPRLHPVGPVNLPHPFGPPLPDDYPHAAEQFLQRHNVRHQLLHDQRQAMIQQIEERVAAEVRIAQEFRDRRTAPVMRNFGPQGQAGQAG